MKLVALLFIFSFTIISCDAPVRTRVSSAGTFSNSGEQDNPEGFQQGDESVNGGNGTLSDGNGTLSNQEGFQDCEFLSPQFNGGSIGFFGICQNSNDQRKFKAIFADSSSQGTCFVPLSIANNGNSFKLGRAECTRNQPDQEYLMTLNKELIPPNFTQERQESINGVMVIKAESLNSFMGCMNAKEDYFITRQGCCAQKTYNPSTARFNCLRANPLCENDANAQANFTCNLFVQNHADNYRQVNF